MKRLNRNIARSLVISMACLSLQAAPVHAELVPTDRMQPVSPAQGARARLDAQLARSEVRDALARHGVDPADIDARVAALSDEEARDLADRLDALPAGQGIIGVLFAVFVILLVTDILGFTKVFSFTRQAK